MPCFRVYNPLIPWGWGCPGGGASFFKVDISASGGFWGTGNTLGIVKNLSDCAFDHFTGKENQFFAPHPAPGGRAKK